MDFVYRSAEGKIRVEFANTKEKSNELPHIVYDPAQKATVLSVPDLLADAPVETDEAQDGGEVVAVYLRKGTAKADFDSEFFLRAAVSVEGKNIEYSENVIRLTGDVVKGKVTFTSGYKTLEVEINNYTAPAAPVVPETENGFAYRFCAVGETASVADMLVANEIISSYCTKLEWETIGATITGGVALNVGNAVWTGPQDVDYSTIDATVGSEYNRTDKKLTLSAANSWQYEFKDLPKQGWENTTKYLYCYAIQEVTVPGFTTTYTYQNGESIKLASGTANALGTDGMVQITNNRETTKITAKKKWGDNVWPTDVTAVGVKLTAKANNVDVTESLSISARVNGNDTTAVILQPASGNEASVAWSHLPLKTDAGVPITYTVEEISVTKGGVTYTASTTMKLEDLFTVTVEQPNSKGIATITNTYNPGVELPATGGSGTALYTFLGLMILLLAGGLLLFNRRRGSGGNK